MCQNSKTEKDNLCLSSEHLARKFCIITKNAYKYHYADVLGLRGNLALM